MRNCSRVRLKKVTNLQILDFCANNFRNISYIEMNELLQNIDVMFARATAPTNTKPDLIAIDVIVSTLTAYPTLSTKLIQKISTKVNSTNQNEVLQTLDLLDECMNKCGSSFQSEIGKFKFLNDLIKLVSPKYLGDVTPPEIRKKILDLLLMWCVQYPREHKIKEAYDMLLSQQKVVHEPTKDHIRDKTDQPNCLANATKKEKSDYFHEIPQKLLNSVDPKDVQAANLLIGKMIEKEKREAEIKITRKLELKKIIENVTLLDEMLNCYQPGETSEDELTIIKELFNNCESLRTSICRLTEDLRDPELLDEALSANDSLVVLVKRYKKIMLSEDTVETAAATTTENQKKLLLDEEANKPAVLKSSLDELRDVFSAVSVDSAAASSSSEISKQLLMSDCQDLLKPILAICPMKPPQETEIKTLSPLNVIDNLSENLFNEYLPSDERNNSFKKEQDKTPLNVIKQQEKTLAKSAAASIDGKLDLESILGEMRKSLTTITSNGMQSTNVETPNDETAIEEKPSDVQKSCDSKLQVQSTSKKVEVVPVKPLSELNVDINTIRPKNIPPKTIMDDSDGLKILLHFTEDRPRADVCVFVITTINQTTKSISDYQFDASVSKPCKLRLLPASGQTLPEVKPFSPPSNITQILMLATNQGRQYKNINLTCIVSYCLGNDPDPIKESVLVSDLPLNLFDDDDDEKCN